LETNNENINNLFKQKFEDFAPQPPDRVWAGIESALDNGVATVWYNTLAAKVVALLLGVAVLLGGYWLFKQQPQADKHPKVVSAYQNTSNGKAVIDSESNKSIYNKEVNTTEQPASINTQSSNNNNSNNNKNTAPALASASNQRLQNIPASTNRKNEARSNGFKVSLNKNKTHWASAISNINQEKESAYIKKIQSISITALNNNPIIISPLNPYPVNTNNKPVTGKKQNGKWALGFYFAPEFIFDPFDSLTIQNSYALRVEPTYYINNHWFIRPGIGISYARDKGFVKTDYLSWDYLGSYEDVVDVTFDTVENTIIPVYHTQTRDVYDSILHLTVSEETNRYLYLQTSLVFGYHNHVNKFGWSIYAGPQISFILAEKRDNPVKENTTIIYLNYNLAERKSPRYGLKLGFGIDYVIAKKWLVTVEPEYNYYLNGINGGNIYNTPLSGIGLRFGFVYTIK